MADPKVLDSWAVLCYLEQEPGYQTVIRLFEEAVQSVQPLLMSVVNWGEVYYQVMRRFGEGKAWEIERTLDSFPIRIVAADRELTRLAARFKASNKIAYADCFAAALAKQNKATLYTGDPEFRVLEKEIKVVWL